MRPWSSAYQAAQRMRGTPLSLYRKAFQPLSRKRNSATALQNRPHHSAREKTWSWSRPIGELQTNIKSAIPVQSSWTKFFTQIEFHLDAFKLLPSHQSAYRKYHSTETLLARVASDLISDASNGKHTLLAMLDLSAAFDTVDHTILLERLAKSFGISDQALRWFASYLTERFQSVHFAGKTSSSTQVRCGVPQGSVLGPLLFLLYTADIGSIASKYNINSHSFADDTQLYLSGDPSEAQFLRSSIVACINEITEWCATNKLKLNPSKTEFLWSATARRQVQLDHTNPSLRRRDPPKQSRPWSGCFNRLAVELRTSRIHHHEQILQWAPKFEIVSAVTTSSCSTYACK